MWGPTCWITRPTSCRPTTRARWMPAWNSTGRNWKHIGGGRQAARARSVADFRATAVRGRGDRPGGVSPFCGLGNGLWPDGRRTHTCVGMLAVSLARLASMAPGWGPRHADVPGWEPGRRLLGDRLHLRPPNRAHRARRFTSEGFSYRSRRRSSRFNPERSTIFRKRRTASWTDSRSRSKILTKVRSPLRLPRIPPMTTIPNYTSIDRKVKPASARK